jgi:NADPH2:quinone reductase
VPIVSADYSFADSVKAATHGRGVDVVFDGLGRLAERETYESLASTGHWISFGHTTGALPPLDPSLQSAKSLRLSRPVLFHYTDDPVRLRVMAANVFAMLQRGVLKVDLRHRFPLSAAAAALDALESRQTTGSIILVT